MFGLFLSITILRVFLVKKKVLQNGGRGGGGGGVDFCVNLLARLHHIQLLSSTYFYQWHFLFALVIYLTVRNNSCGNSSSWKFLLFFINIFRVLIFAADFNLFNCVFVSLNLAPWHFAIYYNTVKLPWEIFDIVLFIFSEIVTTKIDSLTIISLSGLFICPEILFAQLLLD